MVGRRAGGGGDGRRAALDADRRGSDDADVPFISIPMADRRQSGKPGFEAYKAETGMLLPLRSPLRRHGSGGTGTK